MKIVAFVLLSFALLNASPVSEGNKFFANGDYGKALESYLSARKENPAEPALFYNIGTCQYMLGNYEDAIKELEPAVRFPDSSLAAKAAYNLANAYFRSGEKAESATKIEVWRQSIAYLKKAIELVPNYEKAKKNIEIVQRRLKEALDEQKNEQQENDQNKQDEPEMSEAAKAALARALQFCKEGKYAPAKELLEKVVAEDATASKLQSYVQRIDDVIEIQAGRKPKAKIDASNVDNDLEVI